MQLVLQIKMDRSSASGKFGSCRQELLSRLCGKEMKAWHRQSRVKIDRTQNSR
jgi:hypothetical protein